jgi:hypothetical protein
MAGLRKSSGSANFTALHLRIEDDWIEHCKTWKGGDNCYTNTDVLDNVLEIEGVPTSQPLYLAAGIPWELLKVWLRACALLASLLSTRVASARSSSLNGRCIDL